ncbi:hypothetical protein M0R36_02995 [bacterium]|nr:hypothetical protein [bacterium]
MCDKEKLVDLAWGEIEKKESEKLFEHLNSCAGCRAEYEKIMAVREIFLERRKTDAPAGYFESLPGRITGRIKNGEKAAGTGRPGRTGNIFFLKAERIAVVAAAACIFIIAGYYFVHNEKTLERETSADKPDISEPAKREEFAGLGAENEKFDFSPVGKPQIRSGFYTRPETTKLLKADIESKPLLERKDGLRKARGKNAPVFMNLPELGMRIQEIDGYKEGPGFLIVEDIDETSKGYNKGIRRGDKIIKLQGNEVNNIGDARTVYDGIDSGVYEIETDRGNYIIRN